MRLSWWFFGAAVFAAFAPFSVAQSTHHQPFVADPAASGHSHEAAAVTAATPAALVECEQNGCGRSGGGAAWVFDGVHGQAAWAVGAVADLTIDSFDGQHIQISRADPPGTYSSTWAMPDGYFRAVYVGTVSADQIHGTVVWNGDVNHPGVWQAAIVNDRLCDKLQDCPVTVEQLMGLGGAAYEAKQMQSAFRCFKAAGGLGNPTAEGLAAFVLYEEKGSPARQREGFRLAQDSASHNNAVGMMVLGKMYRDGVGTQANPAQAKFWMDKGKAQQDDEAKAQAARQQQLNAAAGLLGLLGGALLQSWDPEADAAYKRCVDYATANHEIPEDLHCYEKIYGTAHIAPWD